MAVIPTRPANAPKHGVAEPRRAAQGGVLSRLDSAAIGAPCVLALHHPAHLGDGWSAR
jgi:hypothetical protein